MGEFILLMAQDAAADKGVAAEAVIRHGDVGEEIIGLCHELEASYVVLGWPKVEQEDAVFTRELLRRLVERTEAQTEAKVVFPEEVDL
jgi:hypothetical protein